MTAGDATSAQPPATSPRALAPESLLAAGVFVVAILLLFAPALSSDAQFLYRDTGRLHAPVKSWIARELASGRLPTWNPYEGLGTSLVTDPIHAIQHPFNLLLLLLPFDAAFKCWILACYLVAALGARALARRLGADATGATLAGLAYSLSGFLVSSSDNLTYLTTAAFAPWVLAAGHDFVASWRAGPLAKLMIASWLCAASGDPLAWAISVALVPALALAQGPSPRRAALLRGLCGAGASFLAAAPIMLPLARGLSESARGDAVSDLAREIWNLHPLRLPELALPHLTSDPAFDSSNQILRVFTAAIPDVGPWVLSIYVGATVLVLALAAATVRQARPLLALAALFTWAALGPHAGFGQLAARLPLLASLRYWEKLAVWPTLLLAVAAGLGAGALLDGRIPARRVARVAGGCAGCGALLFALASLAPLERWLDFDAGASAAAAALAANVGQGSLHLLALAGALAALALLAARRGWGRWGAPLLLLVVGVDLVGANVRAYRLAPPLGAIPPSALRTRLAAEPGLPALVTPFHVQATMDDGLLPWISMEQRGAQIMDCSWNVADRVRNSFPYSALFPRRYARYENAVALDRRVPALGLFGFGFVAVPGEPSELERTALRPPWVIAAKDAKYGTLVAIPHRPRAYLAESVRSATAEEALTFAGDPASVSSPLTLVEGAAPAEAGGGRAEIVEETPGRIRIRASSATGGLLVLNDSFAPGWTATVDGRPAEILAANYLVRGVRVGAGEHEVRFRYRPPLLAVGWAIALLSLAGVLAAPFLAPRRRCRSEADMQTLPPRKP